MFDSEIKIIRNTIFLLAVLLAPVDVHPQGAEAPVQVFEFGDFALHVPADVPGVRGIFLALGGPDTRAFVTDGSFGAPKPELEAGLHELGRELRRLAASHGLAMLGTSLQGKVALPNQPQTDELIFTVIGHAATISGHPELTSAPIFIYGISGGTPQAIGFTTRNPGRVGALLLKVPATPKRLDSAQALAVPTYLILAEHEEFSDNRMIVEVFQSNRRAGGLWAVAMEPGVPHHSLTSVHRALTQNWLHAIVDLRLRSADRDSLHIIPESSGWLGHPVSGVADWADYTGDRAAASWFPTQATAEEWWKFINQEADR